MKKEVIKFCLSGDYALFKKPFANNQPQSFIIPPKTAILGMIGAIMGWSKDEYMSNLPFDNFHYAVKLTKSKIKKDTVGINLMQGKGAKFTFNENPINTPTARGQRSPTRYEFIKDAEWKIFLMLEDDNIRKELFERLQKKKFVYNPNLGMQQLFAKISDEDLLELSLATNLSDTIYTSFEKQTVKFRVNSPVAFYNELIPVSFEQDRSLPITKEMISFVGDYDLEITNKEELKNILYEDNNKRLYQFI